MKITQRFPDLFLSPVLAVLCAAPAVSAQDDDDPYLEDVQRAEKTHLKGRYSKARALYEEILEAFEDADDEDRPGPRAMLRTRQGLIRLALTKGEYEHALKMYTALPKTEQAAPGSVLLVSRAWNRTGEYEKAIKALDGLVADAKGNFEARYRLGRNLAAAGKVTAARKVFAKAIADADRESVRDPLDICYIGKCHLELGGREHLEPASGLLVESVRLTPDRPEARIALAEAVFLAYRESRKGPTAESYLKKVLQNNGEVEDALLLMYRSRITNMFLTGATTMGFLSRALAVNPNSVPALVARAKRLIDDRLFEDGVRVLDQALGVDPRHRAALSHRAAVAYLLHDDDRAAKLRARAHAGHEGYAEIDRIFGDHLVALYRFKDAIPYFRTSLERQKDYVPALHGLAKAYIYSGQGPRAASLLKKAKELEQGYADVWRTNMLLAEKRLKEEYETVTRGDFVFAIHKSDRAVLEDYLATWFQEAHEFLGRKYGYKPEGKVRVEVLHEWVDFSVRTIGFRGFSALGACFGDFITMVSPSDDVLRRNDFMWSATAWHEYTHVLTLALSKHRVPRWLTEGMSVYEESAKNRSWERGMVRDLLDAYYNEELPPLRLLNRVFRGRKILFGYYQGGLIVEYLAAHHGFAKVVSMLKAYGEDQGTEQIFHSTFGISSREFDRRFKTWVKEKKLAGLRIVPRYSPKAVARMRGQVEDNPNDLEARVGLAWSYLQRRHPVEAGIHVGAVLRKQPNHAMANLVYAELQRQRKETDGAIAAYMIGFKGGADDFDSRLRFAKLLEAKGRLTQALAQYQAAKACWPRCTDQKLAPQLHISRVLREQGKQIEAMMEIKSFCKMTARAFQPRLDLAAYERKLKNRKAEAQYLEEAIQIDPFMRSLHAHLGDAYFALGKKAAARREYKVGLVVPTAMDRAHLKTPPQERPTEDSPEEAEARGRLCVQIAKVSWSLGDKLQAAQYLDRAEVEAPNTDVADEVHELRARWKL